MAHELKPTEFYVVGTKVTMWIINTLTGHEDKWLIRVTAPVGNYFYEPDSKHWVLAGEDDLNVDGMATSLEQAKLLIDEAETAFLERA